MKTPESKTKYGTAVSCVVPDELWQKFRLKRFNEGISLQAVVIKAVAEAVGEDPAEYLKNRRIGG